MTRRPAVHRLLLGQAALAVVLLAATPTQATFRTEGLYCGTALSGGELVEVRTRFEILPDGLLKGVYDFADQGETTSGTLREYLKTSDRDRTLVWVDKYGTGQLKLTFSETGERFDGKWGVETLTPEFRWDGEPCSDEMV